eukprot:49543-Eustigmatos_ZCMA.PRE.1
MTAFSGDRAVQSEGCGAIVNLARGNVANRSRLAKAGACERVCSAMSACPGDRAVQEQGCMAVGYFAWDNAQN